MGRGGAWRESLWDTGETLSTDSVVSANPAVEVKEGFLEEGSTCLTKSWMVATVTNVISSQLLKAYGLGVDSSGRGVSLLDFESGLNMLLYHLPTL